MPEYIYETKDNTGKVYKGSMEADNVAEVRRKLADKNLYITLIKEKQESLLFKPMGRVKMADLTAFTQQLADMLGAGIQIRTSLNALEKQAESPILKKVIRDVELDLEGGSSFSNALSKHPKVFSEFFVSMVKAGETGGVISDILDRLASHLCKKEELHQKVKSAFAYPLLVSITAFFVVTFLLLVIIPIFTKIYKELNIVLPGPTVTLIMLSRFLTTYWWMVLLIICLVVVIYRKIRYIPVIRNIIDTFLIGVPIFGKLNRMAAISRFIRTFGNMFSSGIPILESLDVADKVIGNTVISKMVTKMKDHARSGARITKPLMNQSIFSPLTVQMMAIGEESGTLDKMLALNANTLDRDIDILVKAIVTKIEPLLTMILAAIVGFITLAVYLPIFDLIQQIAKR